MLDITDPDLICIYGNILDNAREACRGAQDASVSLKTEYKTPYLVVSCLNTVNTESGKKQRRIPELERGVGFTILSNLAGQYDGQFITRNENGMFYTEIILKTRNGEEYA